MYSMEKTTFNLWACIALLAMVALYVANARDPGPLQDFCVATNDTRLGVFVNGMFCKDPNNVTANDFLYRGFNTPGTPNNRVGSLAMMVNASVFPGLNTQGLTIARIDFAPQGLNPPHSHPRSSEVLLVQEGTLYAGFVTSNLRAGGNRLFAKVLTQGDLFLFPQGLIHFQFNLGDKNAVAIATFGSQNPGLVTVANAVFGSTPPIMEDVLTRGFQLDENIVKRLQSLF